MISLILEWLYDQRSTVIGSVAVLLFIVTLVLRYGFGLWWPWGIVMSVVLAGLAIFTTGGE